MSEKAPGSPEGGRQALIFKFGRSVLRMLGNMFDLRSKH